MSEIKVLDQIRELLIDSSVDTRYRLGAYTFVLNGLEFYLAKIGTKRHVTGQELSKGLAEFATKQFGAMAWDTLSYLGIHTTDDFGYIVYNLISIGMMSRQAEDTLEDFFDVFDLQRACLSMYTPPEPDKDFIRSIKGA